MSESKQQWTPGPWTLTPRGDLHGSNDVKVVFAGDGFSIGSVNVPEWKANGDLAKAAPELAEALNKTTSAASDALFVLQELIKNDYCRYGHLENIVESLDKSTDAGYAALAKAGA